MANILFLAHALPYPPDKAGKVCTYHLLKVFPALRNRWPALLKLMALGHSAVGATVVVGASVADTPGKDVIRASTADVFSTSIQRSLVDSSTTARASALGHERVLASSSWELHLSCLDRWLGPSEGTRAAANPRRIEVPA